MCAYLCNYVAPSLPDNDHVHNSKWFASFAPSLLYAFYYAFLKPEEEKNIIILSRLRSFCCFILIQLHARSVPSASLLRQCIFVRNAIYHPKWLNNTHIKRSHSREPSTSYDRSKQWKVTTNHERQKYFTDIRCVFVWWTERVCVCGAVENTICRVR